MGKMQTEGAKRSEDVVSTIDLWTIVADFVQLKEKWESTTFFLFRHLHFVEVC